jgi:hypothetical protein
MMARLEGLALQRVQMSIASPNRRAFLGEIVASLGRSSKAIFDKTQDIQVRHAASLQVSGRPFLHFPRANIGDVGDIQRG